MSYDMRPLDIPSDAAAIGSPRTAAAAGSSETPSSEVAAMEQRWSRWRSDVEEGKRLVLEEVEEVAPPLAPWMERSPRHMTRARRRTGLSEKIVACFPVFYGWVIAVLAALASLLVSPVQVFCVGVVLDSIQYQMNTSRVRLASLYCAALLFAAPVVLLRFRALDYVSRQTLVLVPPARVELAIPWSRAPSGLLIRSLKIRTSLQVCGLGFCAGCLLVAGATNQLTLLCAWTLLQVLGPGMLYPAVERAQQQASPY
jgi:hypothetical protein